ncbi:uncharacterized protein A4U43_C07F9750 [Asparagus officinalis]|uniref:Nucleolar protein 16 n=1 Tax=Asparagus officinalis TaxID=4686 RepID=A0A5P1EAN9_ASPOF|nr:uncharacterized protein LOC109850199 [Asparagus officinalis]XP_020275739.1 uncharacterized protein LOC109850199 [Asparagus officinalis]XP_020275740.1 uncharacterized protein LOC109850199 [Asparagus officinalis]ONK62945.1 uncharacterized protein A4U43_C07F9750 [Asparagus officinalis]
MGGSRRKLKRNRAKVKVALPKKKPGVFKPAFTIPEPLLSSSDEKREWDEAGSVIRNYRSFGVVSNPNLLGVRARTPQIVQCSSLQVPNHDEDLGSIDSGSDLESDDLKAALGKKRRDGKAAPLRPLTTIQRVHIGRLIEKYGDNYQAMFKDIKLNAMQHSAVTLKKLCQRYYARGKCYVNVK